MLKKRLVPALCVCLAAALLAGCGTKYSDRAKDVEVVEDARNTLIYWSSYEQTDPQAEVISDAVKSFTRETGIAAKVEFKGDIGMRDGVLSALNDGTKIDLVDGDLDEMNLVLKDELADLEKPAEESRYDETAHAVLMRAARDAGDGKLLTIPFQPEVTVIYYNRQMFEKAGITEEPLSWKEFLSVCAKLKKAGYTPFTSDDRYAADLMGCHLARLLGSAGAEKLVDASDWSDEAVFRFAGDYSQLYKRGYVSARAASNVYPEGEKTEFAAGDAAMYLADSSMPAEIDSIVDGKFTLGCFNYPELEGGNGGIETAMMTSRAFGVPKSGTMSEEAFQLITYLTKGKWDKRLADETGGIPADAENDEWPEAVACVKPVFDRVTVRLCPAAGLEDKSDSFTRKVRGAYSGLVSGSLDAKAFVEKMKRR